MEIDKSRVEKIADLAKLSLTDKEKMMYAKQLNQIVEYMDILNQVDTSGIDLSDNSQKPMNIFREDKPGISLPKSSALRNAPETDGSYFKVPKVLKQVG